MGERREGLLDRLAMKRVRARWRRAAAEVPGEGLARLAALRNLAGAQRSEINRFLHQAEARLAAPIGSTSLAPQPTGTDWAWRPDLWAGPLPDLGHAGVKSRLSLGPGTTLFHDCPLAEIGTRQIRNPRLDRSAPYGLRLDIYHFTGSFLSVALDLPPEALQGLRTRHLIRLDLTAEFDRPLEVFVRLNVKHGPNVEQLVRELSLEGPHADVEFDLFYTQLNEKRVEQAWLDLIFEGPAQNQINLRDVRLSRRPRAEL